MLVAKSKQSVALESGRTNGGSLSYAGDGAESKPDESSRLHFELLISS